MLLYRAHLEGGELDPEHMPCFVMYGTAQATDAHEPPRRCFLWHPDPKWSVEAIEAYHGQLQIACDPLPSVMTVVAHYFTQGEILKGCREGYISPDAAALLPEPEVTITLPVSKAAALYDAASVGCVFDAPDDTRLSRTLDDAYSATSVLADACRKVRCDRDAFIA